MSLLETIQRSFQSSESETSSIVVVGTVAFDSIETPFGKAERIIGGTGAYISLVASYFTQNINLVSVVGGDFPKSHLKMLNDRGVNTEGVQIRENEKSFFWQGKYHLDMNTRDTLVTDLNVLATFDPVLPDGYKSGDFLMLGNLTPAIQISVIKRMKKRPKLIVMDTMNFWMKHTPKELAEVFTMVDVLVINDAEARELTHE